MNASGADGLLRLQNLIRYFPPHLHTRGLAVKFDFLGLMQKHADTCLQILHQRAHGEIRTRIDSVTVYSLGNCPGT